MSNTQNQDYGSKLFADLLETAIKVSEFLGTSGSNNVFGNDTPMEFVEALISGDMSKITSSPDEASANLFSNYLKSLVAIRQTIRHENVIRYVAESADVEAAAKKLNDKALDVFHGLAEKKHNLLTQIEFADQNISSSILFEDRLKWQEVRDITLKELDKVNESIEIQRKLFGVRISRLDSPEQILDKIVGENYGKTYFNEITKVFNYANFVRLMFDGIKLEETNAQAIFDYTAGWINYTATVVEGKAVGLASEKLDDVLHTKLFAGISHLSTKTILATAARGVIVGVMTDISYKLGYMGGEWLWNEKFKEWYGVTATEYYADEFQALYSTIFSHLTANKLNAVIVFNTLLLGNFVNAQGKSVITEDTAILFGSDDYKEMDFGKALKNYQAIYKIITGKDDADSINDEFAMLRHMEKSYELFRALKGQQFIIAQGDTDTNEFSKMALVNSDDALAYRYALVHFNPFVLLGADYSKHNQNGELELHSKDNPNGLSEAYLEKRAEMLAAWLKNDPETLQQEFKDHTLDIHLQSTLRDYSAGNNGIKVVNLPQIIFGSDKSERTKELNGGMKDDFIFGGGGNDVLRGDSGLDYLEGGIGNDELRGGGQGDTLDGGIGNDSYHIMHHDTIIDADMIGKVIFDKGIDGKPIQAKRFIQIDSSLWKGVNDDGTENELYALRENNDLKVQLMDHSAKITDFFDDKNKHDKSWQGLGIVVEDKGFNPFLKFSTTPFDSYRLLRNTHEYKNTLPENTSALIHEQTRLSQSKKVQGSSTDDMMFNTQNGTVVAFLDKGNDLSYGGYGYDWIYGEEGNDMLFGSSLAPRPDKYSTTGLESKVPLGLLDRDYLVGGAGSDLLFGVDGNDVIYTDTDGTNNATVGHLLPEDKVKSALRGDLAAGGLGDDRIYGSLARDLLTGGAGRDTIFGGAGDDVVIGDGQLFPEIKRGWQVRADEIVNGTKIGTGVMYRVQHLPFDTTTDNIDDPYHKNNQNAWDFKIENEAYTYHSAVGKRFDEHRVKVGGGADWLSGGYGNDLLIGQDGQDYLDGGHGNDVLWGDDYLDIESFKDNPEMHNDTLVAGKGTDHLYGGYGNDTYVFTKADLTNAIYDKKFINDIDHQGVILIDGVALDSVKWTQDTNNHNHWFNEERNWNLNLTQNNDLILSSQNQSAFVANIIIENFQDKAFGLELGGTII